MKILKIIVLGCVLTALLCQVSFAFTAKVKKNKPSPSPGTYIPADETTSVPVAEPSKDEPEVVKNPMEIDLKEAKNPPPVPVETPQPKPNNMPIILGGVAGVIILVAGVGIFLHQKNSNQEF